MKGKRNKLFTHNIFNFHSLFHQILSLFHQILFEFKNIVFKRKKNELVGLDEILYQVNPDCYSR